MERRPTFAEQDDPARNDRIEEHVVCSTCTRALTSSTILNPSLLAKLSSDPNGNQASTLPLRRVNSFPQLARGKEVEFEQRRYYGDSEAWAHHRSPLELKKSSDSGCHLCTLIWRYWMAQNMDIESGDAQGLELADWPPFFICINAPRSKGIMSGINVAVDNYPLRHEDEHGAMTSRAIRSIRLLTVDCNTSKQNYSNSLLSEVNSDIHRLHHLAQTAKSTASDWTIGLAKFWLQSCINDHVRCPKPSNYRPTRLLDLTEPARVRVRETRHLSDVEYLTLSHCWGGANMFLLESSTADSLFSGVELSTMPKTFRDAMNITTRLGYNYLWIDSLCIMQDSNEDWMRESRMMDQIYRHSVCTISALAAFDSREGCFVKRNPLQYRSCDISAIIELPLQIRGEYMYRLYFEGSMSYIHSRHGNDGLQGSLLHLRKRGWVFQEDLMSPRTLYFGEDGIRWECLELNVDEAHDFGDKCMYCKSQGSSNRWIFKQQFVDLESHFSTIASVNEDYYPYFHKRWWLILEQYSQLLLTIPTDKLVAIIGPIRAIESHGSLTNLAGHWKEYLPFELLWTTGKGQYRVKPSTCIRPAAYRAPSWSWASVDGPVHFMWLFDRTPPADEEEKRFEFDIELDAEVVDVEIVQLHTGELFNGQVKGGFITLAAQMRKSKWGEGSEVERRWSQKLRFIPSCDWKQDDHRHNLDEVWCVLIARMNKNLGGKAGIRLLDAGLVLVPHEISAGTWLRVGVFSQSYEADDREEPLILFPRSRAPATKDIIRIL
jgi:Heterokaryon incompatibility protein (HET)